MGALAVPAGPFASHFVSFLMTYVHPDVICLLAQATAQLYEQGGLNHDMSFFLTAVGFFSLERPELQARLLKICKSSAQLTLRPCSDRRHTSPVPHRYSRRWETAQRVEET